MKSLYLRSGLALLCAVILSACGGSDGSLILSGTISGLAKSGLVLINQPTGEEITIVSGSSSFQFTKLIAVDDQFNVTVKTQPTGAKCEATKNTGKANVYTAYYVAITCVTNPYKLGGVVNGLQPNSANQVLILANGADTVSISPAANAAPVNFVFAGTVGDGMPYGITVISQPTAQTCSLTAPTGSMGSTDKYDLVVNCVNK